MPATNRCIITKARMGQHFPARVIAGRTQGLRTFLTPRTSALPYALRHQETGYGTEKLPAIAPCR